MKTKCPSLSFVAAFAGLAGVLTLSGCSANFGDVSNTSTATAMHIQGVVHGGQQPLNGAHVYMYAASTAAYGGNGIAPAPGATGNASVSLLTAATGNAADGNGNFYVTTDGAGNFNIDGAFACSSGEPVYLYSSGGDPQLGGLGVAGTPNPAATLMAVAGDCSSSTPGAAFPNVTFVTMNEESTIAAAYALAGFATDPLHIGAPSSVTGHTLSATGIANAFSTALNLVVQATGLSTGQTTASGSTGTVPASLINSLADILAVCVNSTGPTSSGCTTLFGATENGAGTAPTDTATAAINIAQNPKNNVTALIGTISSTPPFSPTITSAADFTLNVVYTGSTRLQGVAVDGLGNVFATNPTANSITKLSPVGVVTHYNTQNGGNFSAPYAVAIDANNTVWVPSSSNNYLVSVSASGTITNYNVGGFADDRYADIAPDGSIWTTNESANTVIQFIPPSTVNTFSVPASPVGIAAYYNTSAGTYSQVVASIPSFNSGVLTEIEGGTTVASSAAVNAVLHVPEGVAYDQAGTLWVVNANTYSLAAIENGDQTVEFNLTGGALNQPFDIAMDGGGNPWVPNPGNNSVTWDNRAGGGNTLVNYAAGGTLNNPFDIAVDLSGNVWIASNGTNTVTEMVGEAVPVVTPIVANLLPPYTTPASKP